MSWKNIPSEVYKQPGMAQLPNWIARNPHVPPLARLVLLALVSHAGEKLECFVSRETLAEEVGISLSSIKRSLKWLAKNDYIGVTHRYDDSGRQRSSDYMLTFPVTMYGKLIMPSNGGPDGRDPDEPDDPGDLGADTEEFRGGLSDPPPENGGVSENPSPEIDGKSDFGGVSQNPLGGSQGTPRGGLTEPHKKNTIKKNPLRTGVVGSAVNPPAPETENQAPAETPPPSREIHYPEEFVRAGYWPAGDVFDTTMLIKGRVNLITSITNYRNYLKANPRLASRGREWVDQRWLKWIGEDADKREMEYERLADEQRMQMYGAAIPPKKKKFNPNAVAE